jgi:hypothetical protein
MQIGADIMSRIEISYQLHSPTKAAATNIKQPMMRHEPSRHQKVGLKLANFIPEQAYRITMSAGLDLRIQGSFIAITADHRPLRLSLDGAHRRQSMKARFRRA